MHVKEIKEAVDRGEIVHWATRAYTVKRSGRSTTYNVVCTQNGSAIGLTHLDGVTMNGSPIQFFRAGDHDGEVLAKLFSGLWRSSNQIY
jgi:hypothetical protein